MKMMEIPDYLIRLKKSISSPNGPPVYIGAAWNFLPIGMGNWKKYYEASFVYADEEAERAIALEYKDVEYQEAPDLLCSERCLDCLQSGIYEVKLIGRPAWLIYSKSKTMSILHDQVSNIKRWYCRQYGFVILQDDENSCTSENIEKLWKSISRAT